MARESSARYPRRQSGHHGGDKHRHDQGHHRATESGSALLSEESDDARHRESPRRVRPKGSSHAPRTRHSLPSGSTQESRSAPNTLLSADSLAKLNSVNDKLGWTAHDGGNQRTRPHQESPAEERAPDRPRRPRRHPDDRLERHRRSSGRERSYQHGHGVNVDRKRQENRRRRSRERRNDYPPRTKGGRVASGSHLEKGEKADLTYAHLNDLDARRPSKWTLTGHRKRTYVAIGLLILALAIIIPVAIVLSKKNQQAGPSTTPASSDRPKNANLDGISQSDIPAVARGGLLDPFSWYDTTDFNVTFTDESIGGLSIMGLNSTWDDSVQANPTVPPLKDRFSYGKVPYRGVNLGGWLNLEPFITPSFFEKFTTRDMVIDEYTYTTKVGVTRAAQTLEQHYASFVTYQTLAEIRDAGFDHVRIPFGYWAVTTYEGDPYIAKISWRYLLRGIEWARQNGLRVKLDLHGAPGSQNGWNHSGRQGEMGWLNGPDGELNGQRTLDIHGQLSQFFAQPRYKNVVTVYGLLNEPRMIALDKQRVFDWTKKAINVVRGNNITAILVFGDGFMGLDEWQGQLTGINDLVLDVHQYVIFNTDQLSLTHADKITFACGGWTAQMLRSQNTATGFGPTMCGEWSQADTDCTQYLNNVGVGSRWQGTLNTGNQSTSVLSPVCPTHNNPKCECEDASADGSAYSDAYKKFLLLFAQAQMESFEKGWGWFYWTWDTEKAVQWSYKKALAAGIMPKKVYDRSWKCSDGVPHFGGMGLAEFY